MGKPRVSMRMKTKKTKMLKTLKNTFCNKNRQTQKQKLSDMKAWKRFCLQQDENRKLCDIPADELNLLMCKFVAQLSEH